MAPSTISARSFMRGRHLPINQRKAHALIAFNKAAKQKAIAARIAAERIIGKVGLQWGRIELSGLTGSRILAYMQAAALTKPHGFVPGADATYKHLHATKGYRYVPA